MQQGNFPDLKNVMFPSDNPFAYGNQPISTLEENQFGGLQDMPFDQGSNSSPAQSQSQFCMEPFSSFGANDQINRQGPPQVQPNRFGGSHMADPGPNSNAGMFGLPGSLVNEPDTIRQSNQQQGPENEDYWSHAPGKGQFRTGLTPGPTVNLDELFGGGNGWGPANMPVGIDFTTGLGNAPVQSNSNGVWTGSNGHNNWQ